MRRWAQRGLALCLCVDAVGSYVWGNDVAGAVSVSVSRFDFVLDSQMTSCVTSQAVLGVYLRMWAGGRVGGGAGTTRRCGLSWTSAGERRCRGGVLRAMHKM
jgi:hypothetical protein